MVRAHLVLTCSLCDDNKEVWNVWHTQTSRSGVGVKRSACITHHGCVCFSSKVTSKKRLAQTSPTTPRATFSAIGGILGISGHPFSSARFHKVICYKHMAHLDSLDNPNESKWPPPLFLPSLPPSWASLRCWPPAPIAEMWWRSLTRGLLCLRAGKSHPYFGVYQHHLCLCVILKRFWVQIWSASCCSWDVCGNWWCLMWCRATFDPCDLSVKWGCGELRPLALVTIFQVKA